MIIKYLKSLFIPKPKEIWKTTGKVFLRNEEEVWNAGGGVEITNWYVYAIYEESITTGNKRIIEKYQLFPDA